MILILIYLIVEKYLCSINSSAIMQINDAASKNAQIESLIKELNEEIKTCFQISCDDSLFIIAHISSSFIYTKIIKDERFQKIGTLHFENQIFVERSDDFFIQKYNADIVTFTKKVLTEYNKALILFLCIFLRKTHFIFIKNNYYDFLESIKENANSYEDLIMKNIPTVTSLIKTINQMKSIHESFLGDIWILMSNILNGSIYLEQITKFNYIILELDKKKQIYLKYKRKLRNQWSDFKKQNKKLFF